MRIIIVILTAQMEMLNETITNMTNTKIQV